MRRGCTKGAPHDPIQQEEKPRSLSPIGQADKASLESPVDPGLMLDFFDNLAVVEVVRGTRVA